MTDTTAAERGWGSGWPNCQESKMVQHETLGTTFTWRREMTTIFDYLVRRYDAVIENFQGGGDDYAFACRPIRGTRTASNHSWGLALDLNSAKHPLGEHGTFTSQQLLHGHLMVAEMRFVRWGEDYVTRKDGMHWEWMGTLSDAYSLTRRIKALDAWPKFDGNTLTPGERGQRVAMVQKRLHVPITYSMDSRTVSAVRAFQAQRHLNVTGSVYDGCWWHLAWKL